MGRFWRELKDAWVSMLEPPWLHSGVGDDPLDRWLIWLIGWAWTLAGLVLGALNAPSLVQVAGLSDTPYQDWLVIAVAVLAGSLVQLVGWFFLAIEQSMENIVPDLFRSALWMGYLLLLPLAGGGYGLYLYFSSVDVDQSTVTIAFVGGLLIKTFVIPLVKGIVTGALFKWFVGWLRGDRKKGS